MSRQEGLTYGEIAQNLGITPNITEVFQGMQLRDHESSDKLGEVFKLTGQLNAIIHETAQGEVAVLRRL